MPKKQILSHVIRDPVANIGDFEPENGDIFQRRVRKNFGPDDVDSPKKQKALDNINLLQHLFEKEALISYGKKYAQRDAEASMFDLLSGGLIAPLENDYTKGFFTRGDKPLAKKLLETGEVQDPREAPRPKKPFSLSDIVKKDMMHRINKSDSQYVSEAHDNYRKYAYDKIINSFLYDHQVNQEKKDGKAVIEPEEWFVTSYKRDYMNRMKKLAEEQKDTLQDAEIDQHKVEVKVNKV
jgi:hypothetical protein